MANSVSNFYQTLVTAATEASQALVGTNALMESVFLDYKPQVTDIGQTLNINVPNIVTSSVTDAGNADIALTDVSATTTALVFNNHPYYGFTVRDFEQYNTPTSLRQTFLDAAIKGVAESIDGKIAALFTSGNFGTNSPISCTGGYATTSQFLTGYANLADQRVPVTDMANMSYVMPPHSYALTLGDNNWTEALIAGERIAEEVRGTGELISSYGSKLKMDQQLNYQLTSGTAPHRTFTAAMFHRWAVALATRPLPEPDANVVDYTYIDYKGCPIRIMLGYNLFPKMGYVITVDAGYALGVVRPALAQLFSIAE
jgi:hypothetical protein